jgi:hypothetical protein
MHTEHRPACRRAPGPSPVACRPAPRSGAAIARRERSRLAVKGEQDRRLRSERRARGSGGSGPWVRSSGTAQRCSGRAAGCGVRPEPDGLSTDAPRPQIFPASATSPGSGSGRQWSAVGAGCRRVARRVSRAGYRAPAAWWWPSSCSAAPGPTRPRWSAQARWRRLPASRPRWRPIWCSSTTT